MERLTRKLERRKATLADLCQLYRASSRLPMMEEAFREHEGSHSQLLVKRCFPFIARVNDEHTCNAMVFSGAAIHLIIGLWRITA